MDERLFELAEGHVTSMIERGIHNARNKAPKPENFDGFCTCGQEVPADRVAAGYYNCVPCQERIELRNTGKLRRR